MLFITLHRGVQNKYFVEEILCVSKNTHRKFFFFERSVVRMSTIFHFQGVIKDLALFQGLCEPCVEKPPPPPSPPKKERKKGLFLVSSTYRALRTDFRWNILNVLHSSLHTDHLLLSLRKWRHHAWQPVPDWQRVRDGETDQTCTQKKTKPRGNL